MELGERDGTKGEVMTRLALCVVLALVLYYIADKYACKLKLDFWEQHQAWLTENKVQAIAVTAAVLYGASLLLFPEEKQPETCGVLD